MTIDDAVERAITERIEQGILSDFLTRYRWEAMQVSIFEYDEEKELRLMREAERKHWIQESRQQERILQIRNLMDTPSLPYFTP